MYYDRVAVGREDSPSESVNPWCHDLRVFRVIFLKGNTSCLLVEVSQVQEDQEDNTHLMIFNLEVVDTLEIVQGAPFHSHLFRGADH